MPTIRICVVPGGAIGPLGGPFTIESDDLDPRSPLVSSIVQFGRWVIGGMSSYGNSGGIEASSLFKSFASECFDELASENPEIAAHLIDLVVICNELPAGLRNDCMWRLCRAILATLPGVSFVE